MRRGLLVLESPWEDGLDSALSVGPFLQGLGQMLRVKVTAQQFNGREDLLYFLREFRLDDDFATCYIATHGTAGRLSALIEDINSATIFEGARRSSGKGFFVAACDFGNRHTAAAFLRRTGASFVAGYDKPVPWEEAMLCDLAFLTYLLGGRCKRAAFRQRTRLVEKKGDFVHQRSSDPLKVARWVYEDFLLASTLGFVVHMRVPGGRRVIASSPAAAGA